MDFYDRFLNARLSTWEGSRMKKRKGPIIVCYDGSANGGANSRSKAHLFAFMDMQRSKRYWPFNLVPKEDLMINSGTLWG